MLIVRRFIFTFLASMVPAVEVKGAIPFGVALGLDVRVAYIAAILGSGVVVCFLAFITNWFYRFCKERGYLKRFIGWMDKITGKNRDKIQKYGPLAIFVYVAVPIPGYRDLDRVDHCGCDQSEGRCQYHRSACSAAIWYPG